ncbi:LacI family DNA-binding transcriptional regulator [Pseudonocardia acaciae]|uniref:LacI family DNA-binding transcriptional regulator n=1 Tax=Pseudonocardia acaciae TaxID=551276 RepID=UPI00048F0008|nr:LacI family DNA-binding transcriptional regulator [Pseudonocardia acaciae]
MDRGGGRYVTLAQVAQAAEVSLATASRVLNGGERVVRPELRERVLAAARRLRYVPNAQAQALALGATATVGLVMHDVGDPYFAAIARGAIDVATEHGAVVMLGSTFRSPEREIEYVSTLRAQRARAILLVGSGFAGAEYLRPMRAELANYRRAGGRYAFVSHHDLPGDAVLPDNRGGAAAIGRALAELGHRRIAVAAGPLAMTTVRNRVDGFVDALAAAGVARADVRVVETDFSEDGGYTAAHRLVSEGLDATALFCTTDVMAVGALLALRERGVSVPGELSLIGFDDIPIVRHLTPSLSTVALDLDRIGREAMTLVLDPSTPKRARRVTIPAHLVLRDSTARVPAHPLRTRHTH